MLPDNPLRRLFTPCMALAILGISFITWSPSTQAKPSSTLRVVVTGFKNNKGMLGCLLFASAKGFPGKVKLAIQAARSKISKKQGVCLFTNLKSGRYAVTIMHDANNNQKLDTNFFGIPREGYGFSNNAAPGMFGPPPFKKAAFTYKPPKQRTQITVRY